MCTHKSTKNVRNNRRCHIKSRSITNVVLKKNQPSRQYNSSMFFLAFNLLIEYLCSVQRICYIIQTHIQESIHRYCLILNYDINV